MESELLEFKIIGMDCAEEVTVLRKELGPLVGGEDRLSFDVLNGKMRVKGVPGDVAVDSILGAVRRTGMRAELSLSPSKEGDKANKKLRTLTTASGLLTLTGFLLHALHQGSLLAALGSEGMGQTHHEVPLEARILYLMGVFAGSWSVLPKAWHALKRFRPDMNLLMVVAIAGAILIGEWFEGSVVAFLFSLSLALEAWSIGRARRAVGALLNLAPSKVRLRTSRGEEEIEAERAPIGGLFVVKPGERIALDGVIESGESGVNQAPVTGESLPVDKRPGDSVFAGSINGNGSLEIRSTKIASETTLAHIVRLVAQAQQNRAPAEQWVDRFARVYTPAVMALALVIFVVPVLLGNPAQVWAYRALVLLVIACPCALVISTPVSVVAALTASAHRGVLVKGGAFLELVGRLKALAFDKTGTLTKGRLSVVKVVPLSGHTENELLEIAFAMERQNDHPIARAVVEYATKRGISAAAAQDFRVIQGKGATGSIKGIKYWLGSHRYLEERGQEVVSIHDELEALTRTGNSVVVLGKEEHVCGFIALSDEVRSVASQVVKDLKANGVRQVFLLTGDNEGTAKAIASLAGVDAYEAELLPEDKVRAIKRMEAQFGVVGMVGDGINDAPAMAQANVSIAMAAGGSDAAIETSDIALMSDDLTRVPWLIRHSRRMLRIIRQNITVSLSVKALFVILTFVGSASLWSAITADMGASLVVIFNALRLLRD